MFMMAIESPTTRFFTAATDTGINNGHLLFAPATVSAMVPRMADEYRAGSVSDPGLYQSAVLFCRAICTCRDK